MNMQRMTVRALGAGLAVGLAVAGARAQEQAPEDAALWIRGANTSALRVFQRVAGERGNAVLSPWSLGTALSMALAGAGGETAAEMADVLALRAVQGRLDAAQAGARAAIAALTEGEGIEFATAQGLALGGAADLVAPAFIARMRAHYAAEVFRSPDPGPINAWVSEKTRARIPHLAGTDEPGRVWIDEVFHRAMIEVNEEGTEAAAATGVRWRTLSLPPPPIPFHVDRPFLFLLVDRETGAVLFVGRVDDPAA